MYIYTCIYVCVFTYFRVYVLVCPFSLSMRGPRDFMKPEYVHSFNRIRLSYQVSIRAIYNRTACIGAILRLSSHTSGMKSVFARKFGIRVFGEERTH